MLFICLFISVKLFCIFLKTWRIPSVTPGARPLSLKDTADVLRCSSMLSHLERYEPRRTAEIFEAMVTFYRHSRQFPTYCL